MSLKSFKIWLSSYERCVLELEKALHNIRQFASEYDDVIKAEHEGSKDMLDEYVAKVQAAKNRTDQYAKTGRFFTDDGELAAQNLLANLLLFEVELKRNVATSTRLAWKRGRLQGLPEQLDQYVPEKTVPLVPLSGPQCSIYIGTEECVKRGTFGEIYRAGRLKDDNSTEKLALKRIVCPQPVPLDTLQKVRDIVTVTYTLSPGSEDKIKYFDQESNYWAKVADHPHILPYYGTCHWNGHKHMVSPYIEDGDVITYLKLDPGACRITLLRDAASALAHMHKKALWHGDIKAENMLIGQRTHVYICDFGLAKSDGDFTSMMSKNKGTNRFLSPMRLAGHGRSAEDDVHAFGITMAQILRGGDPFAGTTSGFGGLDLQAALKGGRFFPPVPPTSDAVDTALWNLAKKCWGQSLEPPKPAKRRPTMAEVHEELSRLVQERHYPKRRRSVLGLLSPKGSRSSSSR